MSAQPIQQTLGALPRASRQHAAPRSAHLRVLAIPDNEPAPLPVSRVAPGALPPPADPRYVQGSLAVDFRRDGHDELFGPQSTPRQALPNPQDWSRKLITAILEVMDGLRSSSQLVRWVAPDIRERVARQGVLARQRRQRPAGALHVRALRVCEPVDGVAEVAAVVLHRRRVRALALRMSGVDGRWLITALELG